jgi:tight adherence protein B
MTVTSLLAALLAAAAVLCFVIGLGQTMFRRALARRATQFVVPQLTTDAELARLAELAMPAALRGQARRTGRLALALNRRLTRRRYIQGVHRELQRAGLPLTVAEFLVVRLSLTALFPLLTFLLSQRQPALNRLLFVLAAAALGWLGPLLVLRYLQRRRLERFEKQLPDALQMIASALEGGSGVVQGMGMVGREMENPIAAEFTRAMREMALGLTQQEALLGMVDRVPSDDLDMVVTAINIQFRVGGTLAPVLHTIAETMRERERVRGEIRALTAQQRLSANIITVLPFALVAVLFVTSPSYIGRLFEPGITQLMLYTGLVMVGIGYVILRRIANIRV